MCSHPELRWIDVKYETPRSVLIAKLILTGTMMDKASLTQTETDTDTDTEWPVIPGV
jgi:hypothetical protein